MEKTAKSQHHEHALDNRGSGASVLKAPDRVSSPPIYESGGTAMYDALVIASETSIAVTPLGWGIFRTIHPSSMPVEAPRLSILRSEDR